MHVVEDLRSFFGDIETTYIERANLQFIHGVGTEVKGQGEQSEKTMGGKKRGTKKMGGENP